MLCERIVVMSTDITIEMAGPNGDRWRMIPASDEALPPPSLTVEYERPPELPGGIRGTYLPLAASQRAVRVVIDVPAGFSTERVPDLDDAAMVTLLAKARAAGVLTDLDLTTGERALLDIL